MEKENKNERVGVKQLIRILSTDIPGNFKLGYGLTKIKGIGFNFSHAFCVRNNFDESKLLSNFSENEVRNIEKKLKDGENLDYWLLNRQRDYDTGDDIHIYTTDIKFRTEFDVRRLQKVKAYKGMRHSAGLPVRGQRTKAHFRNSKAMGVSKQKAKTGGKPTTTTAKKSDSKK